jgi:YHS domain-containing protein
MKSLLGSLIVCLVLGLMCPVSFAAADKAKDAEKAKPINKKCPVEGGEVDGDTTVQYKGKTIGFCCAGCDKEFEKEPAKFMAIVDKELAAEKKGDAAKKGDAKKGDAKKDDAAKGEKKEAELNAKCPVTGDDVDKEITETHKGRKIAFCCNDCVKDFKKDPDKFVKKLDEEKAAKDKKPAK